MQLSDLCFFITDMAAVMDVISWERNRTQPETWFWYRVSGCSAVMRLSSCVYIYICVWFCMWYARRSLCMCIMFFTYIHKSVWLIRFLCVRILKHCIYDTKCSCHKLQPVCWSVSLTTITCILQITVSISIHSFPYNVKIN